MHSRRQFVRQLAAGATGMAIGLESSLELMAAAPIAEPNSGEGLLQFVRRQSGSFDLSLYKQLLGAANDFKEGDEIIGVAASSVESRQRARQLLSATKLTDIVDRPPHRDQLFAFVVDSVEKLDSKAVEWTFGKLRSFLLSSSEGEIKQLMPTLTSDMIGCVVKLMSNDELIQIGAKVFNPLPGTQIGAKGYLGARVQPNSPTDHPDDIRWQVFDAFSYAVGDTLLGTNPVSSDPESVAQIEKTLQEILVVFGINDLLPHCVLSHIDIQDEVERKYPGSTELWFQSIAGTDEANGTFDLTIDKMKQHTAKRKGSFGLYFETGQGADFTNGNGHGFDMLLHESRKYGFARALTGLLANAVGRAPQDCWVHLNDVAGFIGPEVFRTREQLVRCCLEDIVMGKLHGLCIGLDICSTLHMDVSLDDLDWCIDQIMPANPAYLMGLPTKIDPMLGYLTTGYQDHVRIRDKFGYKVNDAMWKFFQQLGVIDINGEPTEHFGDPAWVYLQFSRKQGDARADEEIVQAGKAKIQEVRERGLFVAERFGKRPFDLEPQLAKQVQRIYEDGKKSIWAELTPEFVATIPNRMEVATQSTDRTDYILHPDSGEQLSARSQQDIERLRDSHNQMYDLQIVVSDGLNAHSIMDEGHLLPFLKRMRDDLGTHGFRVAPENIVVNSGRVRTGYRIGEKLFGTTTDRRSILHIIGERPGTGHHTFSVYITAALGSDWSQPDKVDHNITKVVSGIANTALEPTKGADETVRVLNGMV